MLLFYVRHGDPTYNPDELTPLGKRQAEAVARRLALYGIDRVFSSTSNRAVETAMPTCEILKKELAQLEFANENHAYEDFSVPREGEGRQWAFASPYIRRIFSTIEIRKMGQDWPSHPDLAEYHFEKGVRRLQTAADEFLESLGYKHIPDTGSYRVVHPNEERIALFAHHGFGIAFLSSILDIPYPVFGMHFDMGHTGMTVIHFKEEEDGIARPCVLTLANDSHLYRDSLPTKYNNQLYF